MSETNSVSAEPVTMLTVCILLDGKDILLDVFRNEEIAKGVLVSRTQVKARSVYALNETTFLVTYPSEIWAEDIGSAIKKINEWLGKPVVVTCDEVTAVQLPQVIKCACHTTGVESVVFNARVNDMRSGSNPLIIVDTMAMQAAKMCWGHQVQFSEQNTRYTMVILHGERKGHCQISTVASFYL